MLLSYNWLKELVGFPATPEELKQVLTAKVAEVEDVRVYKIDCNDKIITAQIEKIDPHPNADKLTYCKVNIGSESLMIVCGAKNHREGDKVLLALDGALLPGNVKIQKSKIRGIESNGMMCSAKELGILDEGDTGIMILDSTTPLGKSIHELGIFFDNILEIDNKSITHRPDLWGHVGFAREIRAVFSGRGRPCACPQRAPTRGAPTKYILPLHIKVENSKVCQRYSALVLDNITIKSSPLWLQFRLNSLGIRAINSVVDVTNYVLLELGQPTHAFDYHKIQGNIIRVRNAQNNELIETLDGIKRDLTEAHLVIADESSPLALAGVMGGRGSEVDSNTKTIVIESANFSPQSIRKTQSAFLLRTESSMRFEKSLDPNLTIQAIHRITELLKTIDDRVQVASNIFDVSNLEEKAIKIEVPVDFVQRRLGCAISEKEAHDILERLDFKVESQNKILTVFVPNFRATKDIRIKEDIVEEMGRIFGYNKIHPEAPRVVMDIPKNPKSVSVSRKIKTILSHELGYTEILTHSFIKNKNIDLFGINKAELIKLKNPLSHEEEYLKPSLVPNLLEMIPKNVSHETNLRLFELCNVFSRKDSSYSECRELVFLTHMRECDPFDSKLSQEALYEFKSDIEKFFNALEITIIINECSYEKTSWLHKHKRASLFSGEHDLGIFGELSLALADKCNLRGITLVAIINAEALNSLPLSERIFTPIPKYPGSEIELSIVTSKTTKIGDIEDTMRSVNQDLIRHIQFIAQYVGEQLGLDEKSSSFRIVLQSDTKTLEDKDIKEIQTKIIKAIEGKGWKLR